MFKSEGFVGQDCLNVLQNLIKALAEEGTIPVRIDGPYGSASAPEWTHYDHILMVAGGIGVSLGYFVLLSQYLLFWEFSNIVLLKLHAQHRSPF